MVDLPEDDPHLIAYLLIYLYTYDPEISKSSLPQALQSSAALPFDLFVLADKYGVESLSSHWQGILIELACELESWLLAISRSRLRAARHPELDAAHLRALEPALIEKIVGFVDRAYCHDISGIKAVQARVAAHLVSPRAAFGRFFDGPETDVLISKHPQLVLDLIVAMCSVYDSSHEKALSNLMAQAAIKALILENPQIGKKVVTDLAPKSAISVPASPSREGYPPLDIRHSAG